jgi:hypothetical protein
VLKFGEFLYSVDKFGKFFHPIVYLYLDVWVTVTSKLTHSARFVAAIIISVIAAKYPGFSPLGLRNNRL